MGRLGRNIKAEAIIYVKDRTLSLSAEAVNHYTGVTHTVQQFYDDAENMESKMVKFTEETKDDLVKKLGEDYNLEIVNYQFTVIYSA